MKRYTLISLIDVLAFAGFLWLTTTGILLHFLLPPGSGRWALIWGLNRHQWGEIHFWAAVVFFSVLTIHLFLHWQFIVDLIKGRRSQRSKSRFAFGLVGLVALILLALSPLVSPVHTVDEDSDRQYRYRMQQ